MTFGALVEPALPAMAYFTQTDLDRAIGEALVLRLLDDDNDGTVDAGTLADLVADADGEINGYICRLYTYATIAASPPAPLRRLAVDVAIQLAYLRRPEFLNDKGETPWEGRYRRAVAKLAEIRDGKFRLDVDGEPERPANVGADLFTGTDQYPDGIGTGVWSSGFGDF